MNDTKKYNAPQQILYRQLSKIKIMNGGLKVSNRAMVDMQFLDNFDLHEVSLINMINKKCGFFVEPGRFQQ